MNKILPRFTSLAQKDIGQRLLLTMFTGLVLLTKPIHLVDDAFISFRYAANLAEHGALVFNSGERVEGITNLLWTLLLAGAARLGFRIPDAAVIFSVILIFWMGLRAWSLASQVGDRPWIGVQAWAWVVLSPGFWGTMTNGLEGPLFAALILEVFFQLSRGKVRWVFFFAGLTFFTRPEGLALILVLYLAVTAQERSWKAGLRGLTLGLGMAAAVEVFRWGYYGSLVPNSIAAKNFPWTLYLDRWTWRSIYGYFSAFVTENLHLMIPLVGGLGLALRKGEEAPKKPWDRALLVFALGGLGTAGTAVIKHGGGWMDFHRLIFQYAPCFLMILILMFRDRIIPNLIWTAAVVGLMIPLYPSYPVSNLKQFAALQTPASEKFYRWEFIKETTRRLKPRLEPEDLVAAEAIGYLGYALQNQPVHDLLGLTDPYLARHGTPYVMYGKADPAYSLKTHRPEVVVVHNAGFLNQVPEEMLERYQAYCYGNCGTSAGNLVLIREDRSSRIGPAFEDWEELPVQDLMP